MTRSTNRKRALRFEALEDRLCLDSGAVPPQFANSPIPLPTNGAWTVTPFFGSPVFADLAGNGKQEVIVEAAGGKMIAYGTNAAGQLTKFQEYDTTPINGVQANFKSTPVVVNVPGIGAVIVAALGRDESNMGTVEDGRVYAFNAVTGQVLPGWPQSTSMPAPDYVTNTGVTGALTVGYLEGNGMPDIVVDSFSTMVTAFRIDGSKLWQFENDETVEPGAVVADLYGDGKQEVILDSGIGPSPYFPAGGYITILNGADGSLVRRIHVGEVFFAAPLVADLFGDGRKEIVAATGPYFNTNPALTPAQQAAATAAGDAVYAFFPDGTPVPGWPYHTTSNLTLNRQTWKEPVAADLYGNGQTEVLDIDRSGVLHVISPYGQDEPGFAGGLQINPAMAYVPNATEDFSSPIVADVTGDGSQDIVVSRVNYLAAYDNKGNLIWSTSAPVNSSGQSYSVQSAAAYGRFDPNGPPALVFVSSSGALPAPPAAVQAFQLPTTQAAPAWPMLRDNNQGQAVALSSKAEAAFIAGAYSAIFGRYPTQAEVSYYVPLMTSKALSTYDLAAKLAKSTEGYTRLQGALNYSDADTTAKVTKLYNALGIAQVPADSLAAILYDAHRGRTYDAAAILIVGSGGNYAATSSVAPWAASIYRDIFSIQPTPAQIAAVVQQVDAGVGLGDVVKGLLTSPDARKGYVASQVAALLGRQATAADYAALMNYNKREDVVTAIVSGNEFFARSGGTNTSFVNAAFKALAGFTPDANGLNSWVASLQNGTRTRADLASQLANGTLYETPFVINSLLQYIPDPSKGVLPVEFGAPAGAARTNPDPGMTAAFVNALVNGTTTQEVVLASLMTSQQYLTDSVYNRGIYVSPGVRV